jgi:hypothetical protein
MTAGESSVSLPVTFTPSRRDLIAPIVLSVLLAIPGYFMMRDDRPVQGGLILLFFGGGALVLGVSLHPRARSLTLTEEGFEYTSLFRSHFTRWSDVQTFGIVGVASQVMVAWNYAQSYAGSRGSRKAARKLAGYEAAFPDSYGMSPAELLAILTAVHRDRATGVSGAGR